MIILTDLPIMTRRWSIGPVCLKKKSFIIWEQGYRAICITDLKKTKLYAALEIYINMFLQ